MHVVAILLGKVHETHVVCLLRMCKLLPRVHGIVHVQEVSQLQYYSSGTMDTSASGEGSSSHPSIEMTSADIVHQRTRDVGDDYLEISETPQVTKIPLQTS